MPTSVSTSHRASLHFIQVARRKFIDFLRNFRGDPDAQSSDGRLIYRDKLDQDQVPSAPPPFSRKLCLRSFAYEALLTKLC